MVKRTEDFIRIEKLPRRVDFPDLREALTEMLKCPGGTQTLRMNQAWSLFEIVEMGGLFASIPMGKGKTIISFLAPVVLGSKRPLIVTRSTLIPKTLRDLQEAKKHWRVPDFKQVNPADPETGPCIISYEMLSRHRCENILNILRPDVLIFDECHKARNKKTAVYKRVHRYKHDNKHVPVITLSATPAKRSIRDYGHLADWALGVNSPVPRRHSDIDDWSDALDEGIDPMCRIDPGALAAFLEDDALCAGGKPTLKQIREGFRKRFRESPGVVTIDSADVDAALNVREFIVPPPPKEILDAMVKFRGSWTSLGGEVMMTGTEHAAHLRELVSGFYYKWRWEGGKPNKVWLKARRGWRMFVREVIKHSGQRIVGGRHFDTPHQVALAVKNGLLNDGHVDDEGELIDGPDADGHTAYAWWQEIKDTCDPKPETVWISEFLIDAIFAWAKKIEEDPEKPRGIVWVESVAVLEKLRERGMVCYGGGQHGIIEQGYKYRPGCACPPKPELGAEADPDCPAVVALSISAHQEGKNLHLGFSKNLFVGVPGNGTEWDQAIGRTYREDQPWDEVDVEVYLGSIELWSSFEQARADATYVLQTTGRKQCLIGATIDVTPPALVAQRAKQKTPGYPANPLWTQDWPLVKLDPSAALQAASAIDQNQGRMKEKVAEA